MVDFIYAPPDAAPVILHEDHELVFVNKPAGLLSVPGKGAHMADCLIARLRVGFPEILLVHRLDLDTSGVMVFARTPHAQRHLGLQFEKRQTRAAGIKRIAQNRVANGQHMNPQLMATPRHGHKSHP